MTTQERKSGRAAILKVEGKLSIGAAVDEFRDRWSEPLSFRRQRQRRKAQVGGAHEIVRQAFKMTRLDSVFEFYDTEAAAVGESAAKP